MTGKDNNNSSTNSPELETPPGGQGQGNQPGGGGEGFATPSAAELGAAAVESETAAMEAELDADLVALKGEIEKKLSADAQELGGANIVGVGFGYADPDTAGGVWLATHRPVRSRSSSSRSSRLR
jgi:hypothetical protein